MPPKRRPYESPSRRQQAEQTRRRIIEAGCSLVEDNPRWDWKLLTFRAVAELTDLSERTIYRYFATEKDLQAAILVGLSERHGGGGHAVDLDDLASRTVAFLSWYARLVAPAAAEEAPSEAVLLRRRVYSGVTEPLVGPGGVGRTLTAAGLDLLSDARIYDVLQREWQLSPSEIGQLAAWLLELVVDGIRAGRLPGVDPTETASR